MAYNDGSLAEITAELGTVKAKLDGLHARDNDLTALINQMQHMRASIQGEATVLEERRAALEARRNPSNKLPNELLLVIFHFYSVSATPPEALFHPPPLIPSHVCQRWRELCLETPSLWRRILSEPSMSSFWLTELFLQRSGQHLLDFHHNTLRNTRSKRDTTLQAVMEIFAVLSGNHDRLQSLTWIGTETAHILPLLPLFNKPTTSPAIEKLHISLQSHTNRLAHFARHRDWDLLRNWNSPLIDLRLEHLQPFALSPCLYTNLRRLELNYTPTSPRRATGVYVLDIPTFCDLLFAANGIEVLVVAHLKLGFPPSHTPVSSTANADSGRSPLHMPRLKHIDWNGELSYLDLNRLMSRISCPVLEVLEVGVDKPDGCSRNAHDSLELTSLKELYIETSCNPPFDSSCRTFSFPALEHLEITNMRLRPGSPRPAPEIFVLPRLEHVFRDPRLPHLTHLTLSHFRISNEEGADGRMILGYMPILTFLSLDNCAGVGILLACLQDLVVVTFTGRGQRNTGSDVGSPRVKVCPRLEALDLWGCDDLEFDDLRAVVAARNGFGPVPHPSASLRKDVKKVGKVSDTMKLAGGSESNARDMGSLKKSEEGGGKFGEGQTPRIIKPLRKHRPKNPSELVQGQGRISLPSASLSHMDQHLRALAPRINTPNLPADINHIRIGGCKLVTEEHASLLRDMGVPDIVWKPSTETKFAVL